MLNSTFVYLLILVFSISLSGCKDVTALGIKPTFISVKPKAILDVWGEGRIQSENGIVSGFDGAWNINHVEQNISNGPYAGDDIPNQLPISNYDDPHFPIEDSVFSYITLMGAPLYYNTAKEVLRVAKDGARIFLYQAPNQFIDNLMNAAGSMRGVSVEEIRNGIPVTLLAEPFNQIRLNSQENTPVWVFVVKKEKRFCLCFIE